MTAEPPRTARRRWWPLVLAALCGAMVGVGSTTFGYASGLAYLSNDPAACRNCHIMNEQLDPPVPAAAGK